jgi:hypothetical protein
VFDQMRGRVSGRVDEAEMQAREQVRKDAELRIAAELVGGEEAVEKLCVCLREGVVKRREIAARLRISVAEVTNCRKRLDRKLETLAETEAGIPRWVIDEWKKK